MAIKINSIQGVSTMSANGTNRYTRTNPNINRNPLWNFTLPHTFQGTVAGYATAGIPQIGIDKFPFATNANATDVGNLSVSRRSTNAGQSSEVSGYTSTGFGPASYNNTIDKFPFATNANATDVGDVTFGRYSATGQSSTVSGYTSGGRAPDNAPGSVDNIIDKFPFATNANATDVGDASLNRGRSAGQSSTVSGYTSGGGPGAYGWTGNVIDKFPFATDSNATDVGDLTFARSEGASQSSTVSGYTSAGYAPPGATNIIDKFPFATDANATDVGDLVLASYSLAGQQD